MATAATLTPAEFAQSFDPRRDAVLVFVFMLVTGGIHLCSMPMKLAAAMRRFFPTALLVKNGRRCVRRTSRRARRHRADLALPLASAYSVGARALSHHDRFPGEGNFAAPDKDIDCFVDSWHEFTPCERCVVILRKDACHFARTRCATRSACYDIQNPRFYTLDHVATSFSQGIKQLYTTMARSVDGRRFIESSLFRVPKSRLGVYYTAAPRRSSLKN